MSLYYQPSHKMPLGGTLLFLGGGLVAAAALALLYTYANWYSPVVQLSGLFCVLFGLLLSMALAWLAKRGRLRSPLGVAGLALLMGLAAVYLEWGAYLTLLFGSHAGVPGENADPSTSFSPGLFADFLAHPGRMGEALRQINQTGTWSMHMGPHSDAGTDSTPSGWVLGLFWGLEALLIMAGAGLSGLSAKEPFSEATGEWAAFEGLPHPVTFIPDAAATRAALEAGQTQALQPHLPGDNAGQYARLRVHHVPADPACRYLTVENVANQTDGRGKVTPKVRTVVRRLALSPAAYQDLVQRFGAPGPGMVLPPQANSPGASAAGRAAPQPRVFGTPGKALLALAAIMGLAAVGYGFWHNAHQPQQVPPTHHEQPASPANAPAPAPVPPAGAASDEPASAPAPLPAAVPQAGGPAPAPLPPIGE